LGVTYTVYLWLVGKCVVDFLLVPNELFPQLSRLRRYERIGRKRGWVTEHKFKGNVGRQPTTVGVRKLESLGYQVALFP